MGRTRERLSEKPTNTVTKTSMLPCGHKTNSPSVGWLDSAGFCLLSSPPPRERKDRKTGEVKEREGRGGERAGCRQEKNKR